MDKRSRFGCQAEHLIGESLAAAGGVVLAARWRCRGGELDLVVRLGEMVLFVEVKGRTGRGWDQGGLEAVGALKRTRLVRAAEVFLIKHPELAGLACRFDVALVEKRPDGSLRLGAYLADAFRLEDVP